MATATLGCSFSRPSLAPVADDWAARLPRFEAGRHGAETQMEAAHAPQASDVAI